MRHTVIGIDLQRLAETCLGLAGIAQLTTDGSEHAPSLGIGRVEAASLGKERLCLVQVARLHAGHGFAFLGVCQWIRLVITHKDTMERMRV